MNIQITARKFKIKDSLKEYINEEVKKLNKFNDDIMEANVTLSFTHVKDSIKTVEIVLSVPGKIITATADSEDYSKSVDMVIAKLEKQLKSLKSKKLSRSK